MKESALVRKIIKAVRTKYPLAYVRKLSDRFSRGLPDLMVVAYCNVEWADGVVSQMLFVETKSIYGRQSAIQVKEGNEIKRAGARHIVARSPEAVMTELEDMGAIE